MFSENFQKQYSKFYLQILKDEVKIKERTLKPLNTESKNNIAIIKYNADTRFPKMLAWYITGLGIKWNRVHIFIPEILEIPENSEYTCNDSDLFDKVVLMYSDIIEIHKYNVNPINTEIDLLNKHKNDNVYIIDPLIIYNSFDIPHDEINTVYNLHKDLKYSIRKSYNNSYMQYTKHDESKYYKDTILTGKPDKCNILLDDVFIPAGIIKDNINYFNDINDKTSLSGILYYYFLRHETKIYNLEKTVCNSRFSLRDHDDTILTLYLNDTNYEFLYKWDKTFPEYYADEQLKLLNGKLIDVVFINNANIEMIVENFTNFVKLCNFPINSISIFDNVTYLAPERTVRRHNSSLVTTYTYTVIDNTMNGKFEKPNPSRKEVKNNQFGKKLQELTIDHLISYSNADYLIVVGDKIINKTPITFNPNDIWCGSSNNGMLDDYINIFNIAEMKYNDIKYTTFDEFIEQAKEYNKTYSTYDTSNDITLPKEFDKYNSNVFRVGNVHGYILNNYLIDNFNYRMAHYDYNDRDNQF